MESLLPIVTKHLENSYMSNVLLKLKRDFFDVLSYEHVYEKRLRLIYHIENNHFLQLSLFKNSHNFWISYLMNIIVYIRSKYTLNRGIPSVKISWNAIKIFLRNLWRNDQNHPSEKNYFKDKISSYISILHFMVIDSAFSVLYQDIYAFVCTPMHIHIFCILLAMKNIKYFTIT